MATAAPNTAAAGSGGNARLIPLLMALFFAFGFCTVLVDTLVPKLKGMFSLSYTEVMLTQFCFFGAYFVVSMPAGWLLSKIGYLQGVVVGLLIMMAGCLLFTPAAYFGVYPGFLAALFILASGVTLVQVAANPLTASVGDPAKSHSRLTLAQAFNSVATMIGPWFGAAFILAHGVAAPDPKSVPAQVLAAYRKQEAHSVQLPFLLIAATLIVLAAVCWAVRKWAPPVKAQAHGSWGKLLANRRLVLGAVSIFAYVGAEVSIGSAVANYLMQSSTLGVDAPTAGRMVSIYWGCAMVGRFAGSAILRRMKAGVVLTGCALAAACLAMASALSVGVIAAATVLAIGLANSIMFPTIFTLAIEDLGEDAPQGSGLLCLAIVGGAVVPLITGFAADHVGLAHALFVPAVCYVWIAVYGVLTRTGVVDRRAAHERLGEVLG